MSSWNRRALELDRDVGVGVDAMNGSVDDDVLFEARDCAKEFLTTFPGEGATSSAAGGMIPSSV